MADNPDLGALAITIGHARELIATQNPGPGWAALTEALLENHTPEQLANMLTGAAALIARTGANSDRQRDAPTTLTPPAPTGADT